MGHLDVISYPKGTKILCENQGILAVLLRVIRDLQIPGSSRSISENYIAGLFEATRGVRTSPRCTAAVGRIPARGSGSDREAAQTAGAGIARESLPDAMANDGARMVCNLTSANGFSLKGQVLRYERQRRWTVKEVLDQHGKSGGDLGIGPVIADAIAETVRAGKPEVMRVAAIISSPVSGVFEHHPIQGGANTRPARIGDPFFLNVGQAEDSFAQGECEFRANLENGEVVADKIAKRIGHLVVGGVRFKDNSLSAQNPLR